MSPETKEENKRKAQKRIFVEQVIRLIKICACGARKIEIKREKLRKSNSNNMWFS
ncbi:hypothetical protein [Okeania sp. SIO2C9]|uniref:hypothetical protein n=1 Tax=Okeania sp. SIO2C9 TaxID=2607791 RepID=UPI002600FCD9|nr:hypothetical protein [Okeania sp. SIO2C9]